MSPAQTLRLPAPAKLNLYMRIDGLRPDGYHDLETLFERIDLADELTFALRPDHLRLTCDDPALDCGSGNLVLKAARLLQEATGCRQGASLHLIKRIPIAAGLGGGSSDAATTLIGLNIMWRLELGADQLHSLAAQLGSDVAFFLSRRAYAIGRGRGERLEEVDGGFPTLCHVIVAPQDRLSTKDVYAEWAAQESLTAPAPSITIPLHALRNGSVDELAKGLWNDLGPAAIRRCPVMQEVHTLLRASEPVGTLVSGSGSAIFGLYRSRSLAQQAAAWLRGRCPADWRIDVAATRHAPVTTTQDPSPSQH